MLPADAILFVDASLIAVNKPAGLVVHRSRMANDVPTDLMTELAVQFDGPLNPAHRLDRATSGVILIARGNAAASVLGKQLMSRSVEKQYLAVCRGWPMSPGEIHYDLADEEGGRKQPALTRYEVLAQATVPIAISRYPSQRYSLLRVWPETGRYRQIRRHFHHVSHHLIGDTSHGRTEHNRLFQSHFGCERLLLHAERITFVHPATELPMTLEAPLDDAFADIITRLFPEVASSSTPTEDSAGPGHSG